MSTSNSIEYSVYTLGGGKKSQGSWKKHMTSDDMHKAMEEAQTLHKSQKFPKIEVKKKYYDSKNSRVVDMSIKVLERKQSTTINIPMILLIGAALAGLAFAGTYYTLGQ